jgi:hypothetical protein
MADEPAVAPASFVVSSCLGATRASSFVATKKDRRVKPGDDEGKVIEENTP